MNRIRTVLTALVFWLGIAGAIIAVVLDELGGHIDQPAVSLLVGVLAPAAAVIATLATIIRRVTPVLPDQRGLLPVNEEAPAPDGFVSIWLLVALAVLVVAAIWLAGEIGAGITIAVVVLVLCAIAVVAQMR